MATSRKKDAQRLDDSPVLISSNSTPSPPSPSSSSAASASSKATVSFAAPTIITQQHDYTQRITDPSFLAHHSAPSSAASDAAAAAAHTSYCSLLDESLDSNIEREIAQSDSPPGEDSDDDDDDRTRALPASYLSSGTPSAPPSPTFFASLSSTLLSLTHPNPVDLRETAPDAPFSKQVIEFKPGNPRGEITSIRTELIVMCKLAAPAMAANFCFCALSVVDLAMVGHLGSTSAASGAGGSGAAAGSSLSISSVASAALANTLFNILFFFAFGLSSGLDIVLSEAHGGGAHGQMLIWGRRVAFILTLLCLPIALVLWYSKVVFFDRISSGGGSGDNDGLLDAATILNAESFSRWLIVGIWPALMTIIVQKYLQAQAVMLPCIVISFVQIVLDVLLQYVFIFSLGFGLVGSPIATSLVRFLGLFMLLAYILLYMRGTFKAHWAHKVELERDESEREAAAIAAANAANEAAEAEAKAAAAAAASRSQFPSADGSQQPPPQPYQNQAAYQLSPTLGKSEWEHHMDFFELALPGTFSLMFEMLSFDISILLACHFLPLAQIVAHVVWIVLAQLCFISVPDGLATAASIRIGMAMSVNRPKIARRAAQVALVCGTASMLLLASFLLAFRHAIAGLFLTQDSGAAAAGSTGSSDTSSDRDVSAWLSYVAPVVSLFVVVDAFQGVSAGVLRGVGMHRMSTAITIVSLWCIGLPLAYVFLYYQSGSALFEGLQLMGLWVGLLAGVVVAALLYAVQLIGINWEQKAAERMLLDHQHEQQQEEQQQRQQQQRQQEQSA